MNAGLVVTLVAALPSFAEANAALLLAPYLGWLAFATALSLQIARLNPAGVVMSSTGAWRAACDRTGVVSWYDAGLRLTAAFEGARTACFSGDAYGRAAARAGAGAGARRESASAKVEKKLGALKKVSSCRFSASVPAGTSLYPATVLPRYRAIPLVCAVW